MKLSILTDNNTIIDKYFYGEPAFSALIEDGGVKVLFDTGYSDVFLKNAEKLGIDLTTIDYLILSHGHNDHTGGLRYLLELLRRKGSDHKPVILAHPHALMPKYFNGESIGLGVELGHLEQFFILKLSESSYHINDKIIFLGQIPTYCEFEYRDPIGSHQKNHEQDDLLFDDSALVYKASNGLVVITGCSHSGICNIITHAQKVSAEQRIADIIGGFHLLDASKQRVAKTIDFLCHHRPLNIHACHCTDLDAKIALASNLPLKEVGSGLQLIYDE
jgi:7,8-dihydropterin-6-yl-methyl-4-(beta-D-ribofuranosyl)aminobenzene 5'-phosphate synthase